MMPWIQCEVTIISMHHASNMDDEHAILKRTIQWDVYPGIKFLTPNLEQVVPYVVHCFMNHPW